MITLFNFEKTLSNCIGSSSVSFIPSQTYPPTYGQRNKKHNLFVKAGDKFSQDFSGVVSANYIRIEFLINKHGLVDKDTTILSGGNYALTGGFKFSVIKKDVSFFLKVTWDFQAHGTGGDIVDKITPLEVPFESHKEDCKIIFLLLGTQVILIVNGKSYISTRECYVTYFDNQSWFNVTFTFGGNKGQDNFDISYFLID